MKSDKAVKQQMRGLILLFGGALFVAFLIVILFVFYYGSSGTYLLQHVLVSPRELNEEARIEFIVQGKNQDRWGHYAVSLPRYKEFYSLVANERSLTLMTNEAVDEFAQQAPSTLSIVQTMEKPEKTTLFQRVEFFEESEIFRTQHKQEWLYFRKEGIYQKVLDLFAPIEDDEQ